MIPSAAYASDVNQIPQVKAAFALKKVKCAVIISLFLCNFGHGAKAFFQL